MAILGVSTIFTWAVDMEGMVAFYRDVVGLEFIGHWGEWASFQAGPTAIGLHATDPEGENYGGGWVLGLEVDTHEDLLERLNKAGIASEFHDIPNGRVLAFSDIEGNQVQAMRKN